MANTWSKSKAIGELISIKDAAIRLLDDGETMDQKAASTALTSIKELNALCGIGKSEEEKKTDKVVIVDDI